MHTTSVLLAMALVTMSLAHPYYHLPKPHGDIIRRQFEENLTTAPPQTVEDAIVEGLKRQQIVTGTCSGQSYCYFEFPGGIHRAKCPVTNQCITSCKGHFERMVAYLPTMNQPFYTATECL